LQLQQGAAVSKPPGGPKKAPFLWLRRFREECVARNKEWWTVEPKQWLDASTLIIHASMAEVVRKNDGDYVGPGFGTDLLLTLKFDDAGNWKVVKTHRMSEKEVEEAGKEQ